MIGSIILGGASYSLRQYLQVIHHFSPSATCPAYPPT